MDREDGTDGLEPAVDRLKADALSNYATCHKVNGGPGFEPILRIMTRYVAITPTPTLNVKFCLTIVTR